MRRKIGASQRDDKVIASKEELLQKQKPLLPRPPFAIPRAGRNTDSYLMYSFNANQ
jgi:hypothetical protein